MKKIIVGILIGIIISIVYIGIDSIFNSKEKISNKTAFIKLKNESSYNIVKAKLNHGYGEIIIKNIGKNEVAYLGFKNSSENSYVLSIQFDNDSILNTRGNYFEYGFRGLEIIKNDTIISKTIGKNETITLSAEQINEAAIYNWYDTDGNLIYQGKDLTVSADVTKKYKLEIIEETDGFKDYDEIEVKLKPSIIENISPNPASNQMQVSYKLNGVNSAYLMIIGQYGTNGTSNNYVLDTNSSQTTINVINYTNGFYTVALVCNGQIVDAKTLIKQ